MVTHAGVDLDMMSYICGGGSDLRHAPWYRLVALYRTGK